MNYTLFTGLFALSLLGTPVLAPEPPPEAPKLAQVASSTLDVWIHRLALCESGGKWTALNPMDLDSTPSKGKFQFKETTFRNFAKKYGIKTTSIWNGDEQELIVREMIKDKSVNLRQQFPACVRKLGLPNITSSVD